MRASVLPLGNYSQHIAHPVMLCSLILNNIGQVFGLGRNTEGQVNGDIKIITDNVPVSQIVLGSLDKSSPKVR